MTAAQTINEYLLSNGIKRSFVAEKAGISVDLLCRTLDGRRKLPADEFLRICNALSLDIGYFNEKKTA